MGNGILKNESTKLNGYRCPSCNNYLDLVAIKDFDKVKVKCSFCGSVFLVSWSINSGVNILKL